MSATLAPSATTDDSLDLERSDVAERTRWMMNGPDPPGPWRELGSCLRETISLHGNKFRFGKNKSRKEVMFSVLEAMFPIIGLFKDYSALKFKNDLLAGITLASLCIPQGIGYASLAKLDPQYGLYTSVIPPLVYAVMGTSREIAVGPVAVVSLLLPAMIEKLQDSAADPVAYTKLVLTSTFFAGVFQAAFGILRLGFLVDLLSHAAIVGFMAGAAIIIGLQQLKGLLGIAHFTNKTQLISVLKAVFKSFHHPWNPYNFILGSAFLCFILITRFLGKKYRKIFWLPAISPLISVVLSTLIVFLTRADKSGVKIVKHVPGGLNPISVNQLQFDSPHVGEVAKIGLVVAVIALTEAIAVGRSFASVKGYHIDGNKEMVAMGFTNLAGSCTSCYVATGSFSRTAVNFSAGCETVVSNVVMATTVLISLELFTRLLYYTPTAILASIILSALPGLIDLHKAYEIWRVDKLDFIACLVAFLGVLFVSVEIGLLASVVASLAKILLVATRPGTETLGRLPGTNTFCDVGQYSMALETPGVLVIRVRSSLLCFANANFLRVRIQRLVTEEEDTKAEGSLKMPIRFVIFDTSNLINIDTSGVASLVELHKSLASNGIKLALVNPKWQVIHKLKVANVSAKFEGNIFLTVAEAMEAHLSSKMAAI